MTQHTFDHFRRIRGELSATDNVDADDLLCGNGVLAVGALLGSSLPGAAAAVALLLEHRFPDAPGWPWTGGAA